MSILKRIWGKTKTHDGSNAEKQPKGKEYFEIKFHNHENPERSFSLNSENPENNYYNRRIDEKNTSFHKHSKTEFIMKPKSLQKVEGKEKESSSAESFLEVPKNSQQILSQPSVFTWHNKEAYIFRVESKFGDGDQKPDLEFVIYIPIDTAVTWLKSALDKTPNRSSSTEPKKQTSILRSSRKQIRYGTEEDEQEVSRVYTIDNKTNKRLSILPGQSYSTEPKKQTSVLKPPEKDIKYGVEEEDQGANKKTTIISGKSDSKSDSSDSGDDKDQDRDKDSKDNQDKSGLKANRLKEKKVKGPRKTKKKARRIVTTYEDDEDEVSLGRLRPQEESKQPVKIVEQKKLKA